MKNYITLISVIVFLFLSSIDITRPPVDLHQYRQTQTLSTILNFYEYGINLFKPELNTNGKLSFIILEFPVYQALSAGIMKVFGFTEIIPRFLNIVFTLMTAYYAALFSNKWIDKDSFQPTFIFYLIIPSTIFWSSTILIDPLALLFSVVSIYYLLSGLILSNNKSLLSGAILGGISAMIKLTSLFIPYCILSFIVIKFFIDKKINLKSLIKYLFALITILAFFIVWFFYAKYVNTDNPHQYTNGSISWYLGTFQQRFDLNIWLHMLKRLSFNNASFFLLFLFPFVIYKLIKIKNLYLICFLIYLIFISFLYIFIFINLNFIHTYYQIPINLPLALITGISIAIIFKENNNA
jgi:4-amino-4-deoxy-L-arabinose transferase-like glycosyltransferase